VLGLLCLIFLTAMPSAFSQSTESGTEEHPSLWVGGGVSFYGLQYGDQKIVGLSGVVDADSARRFGVEGEGRWLEYHRFANVHAETYLIGPRYHFYVNRFQPYVKGMIGFGNFNFPYDYAHGTYLIVGAGGGVDYRLSRRWIVRAADVEYQDWPQFTFGSMTSIGVSSGIEFRIF
jgi:hypothetical protein